MDNLPKLLDTNIRLYVIATGAGAGIQQALWEIPGCSSFFVGASFPYEGNQTEELLGFKPESFCSEDTALDLAMSAYMKACNDDPTKKPTGLGLTASVATLKSHRGEHRVYAAVITPDGAWSSSAVLPKQDFRARAGDGRAADRLGLELILRAASLIDVDTKDIQQAETLGYIFAKNVTQQARERFFKRPFFVHGKRNEEPQAGHNIVNILFPGAFNPPHQGHFITAANASPDTIFQITANPPHKEALTLGNMLHRATYFKDHSVLFSQDDPLYLDKARRYPGTTFVIGTDALIRMLDPKWGYEILPMLQEFCDLGVRFMVSRREIDGTLRSLSDLLDESILDGFKHLFFELPPTGYETVSSTGIRSAI